MATGCKEKEREKITQDIYHYSRKRTVAFMSMLSFKKRFRRGYLLHKK